MQFSCGLLFTTPRGLLSLAIYVGVATPTVRFSGRPSVRPATVCWLTALSAVLPKIVSFTPVRFSPKSALANRSERAGGKNPEKRACPYVQARLRGKGSKAAAAGARQEVIVAAQAKEAAVYDAL